MAVLDAVSGLRRAEDLGFARSIALARPSFIAYANDPELFRRGTADLVAALQDGLIGPIGVEFNLRMLPRPMLILKRDEPQAA